MKLTKSQLREIIREELTLLKESTRRPSDSEFKLASKFAKKKGASIDAIGVDGKTGDINIKISKGNKSFNIILDVRGNVKDIELPF